MTVEELKNRYKVIEAKRINDDIVSVDLFHDCEAASSPIIPDEVDLEKVEEAVRDYLKENEIEITDYIEEEISDCFYYMDSNAYRAYDKVEELFSSLHLFYDSERASNIIRAGMSYHGRFIYACEVIQWVSNNLDEWLGENKNGRSV